MALIGDSNVLLTEDILGGKASYFPSYFEFLTVVGERVIRYNGSTGTVTVYTVPENHVFYLCNAALSVSGSNVNPIGGYLRVDSTTTTNSIFLHAGTNQDVNFGNHANITMSYPIPMIFQSGESILLVRTGGAGSTTACISGFLIKKTTFDKFYQ